MKNRRTFLIYNSDLWFIIKFLFYNVKKQFFRLLFSYKYTKIKINSDDDLPLQKTLIINNEEMLIKSVFNKSYNQYYYQVFLKKCSYKFSEWMNNIKMLYYNRIDVPERIDKTN